jgi:uncharacterized membrane protein
MKRLYDLANLALMALMGGYVASAYPHLPDRIPMHFNMAGEPDRWGGRGGLVLLPVMAAVMTAGLYLVIRLLPKWAANPRYLNIPHKAELLRLPAEKQAVYWDVYREFFAALAAAMNLLFYLIVRATVRIATGSAELLPFRLMLPALILIAVILAYYFWRLITLPKKLIRGEE